MARKNGSQERSCTYLGGGEGRRGDWKKRERDGKARLEKV
jgi:hypothetical protein